MLSEVCSRFARDAAALGDGNLPTAPVLPRSPTSRSQGRPAGPSRRGRRALTPAALAPSPTDNGGSRQPCCRHNCFFLCLTRRQPLASPPSACEGSGVHCPTGCQDALQAAQVKRRGKHPSRIGFLKCGICGIDGAARFARANDTFYESYYRKVCLRHRCSGEHGGRGQTQHFKRPFEGALEAGLRVDVRHQRREPAPYTGGRRGSSDGS